MGERAKPAVTYFHGSSFVHVAGDAPSPRGEGSIAMTTPPPCFVRWSIAPPSESQTKTVGPMASRRQRQIVHDHVASAVAKGARLVLGGVLPDEAEPGNFYPPTVSRLRPHRL